MFGKTRTALALTGATMHTVNQAHLGLIAAGVAFYGLMAVFPAITALVTLWGLFANPDLVEVQLSEYRSMMPESAFGMLRDQVHAIASGSSQVLGWAGALSLLTAIWATRAGVGAMIRGLEAAYATPKRGGVHGILIALLLTIILVGVALVALATVVITPIVLARLPLGPYSGFLINLARWLIAITVVPVGIGLLYRMGPRHVGQRTGLVSTGSLLATLLWVVASLAFSQVIENFGHINKTYGSLGAVIALLMWFYLSAFVVLIGGTVNAHLDTMRTGARAARADPLQPDPAPAPPARSAAARSDAAPPETEPAAPTRPGNGAAATDGAGPPDPDGPGPGTTAAVATGDGRADGASDPR